MSNFDDIKKEIIDEVVKTVDRKGQDFEKKFLTMDEFRTKMAEFQAKIEQTRATKNDNLKLFADFLAKQVKSEGLTGDAGSSSLVPESVANTILTELADNWLLQDVTVFPDEKGILFYQGDNVSASWVAVGSAPSEVDTQVNVINYNAQRLVVGQHVGRRLLEMAKPSVANFLLQSFKNSFTNALVTAFIKGTGTGQPTGLYNYTGIPIYTLATGKTSINDIAYDDIAEVYFTLKPQYRNKATWYMNTAVLKVIKKLKDNNGLPIFDPTDNTIFGRPVREVDDMDASGATNPVIYFGYAKDYFIFTSGNFKTDIVRNTVTLVQKDQVYVQLTGYFDGQLVTPNHFVGLKLAAS